LPEFVLAMESTLTFRELAFRTDALSVSASKVIYRTAKQTKLAVKHYEVMVGLRSLHDAMSGLLKTIHAKESISQIESAPAATLEQFGRDFLDVHNKVRVAALQLRGLDLGYWRKLYDSSLSKLDACNAELLAHASAFSKTESPLILLTRQDQDLLFNRLSDPPEPNEALRRAFARR
jgi:hypothetical protein